VRLTNLAKTSFGREGKSIMSNNSEAHFGTLVSSSNYVTSETVTQEQIKSILENDSFIVVPVNVVCIAGTVKLVCAETFNNETSTVVYVSREEAKNHVGAKRLGKHILQAIKSKLKAHAESVILNQVSPQIVSAA